MSSTTFTPTPAAATLSLESAPAGDLPSVIAPAEAPEYPAVGGIRAARATRRPTAALRRGIQSLVRSMRFCLIRNIQGEYRFIDVSVIDETLPREQVEFLLYLTEGRTCAEILAALPQATRACHFDERFGAELAEYFERLAQMLQYNNETFVMNEPGSAPAGDFAMAQSA